MKLFHSKTEYFGFIKKSKKAFSLLETTICLGLVAIISAMAVSAILIANKSIHESLEMQFFSNEMNNLIECYKIGGRTDFADCVEDYLGYSGENISSLDQGRTNIIYIWYDYNFYVCPVERACYRLSVDLRQGILIKIYDSDGQIILEMKRPFMLHDDDWEV